MSSEQGEREGTATLSTAEWAADIDDPVESFGYLEGPDVLAVSVDEESSGGSELILIEASDGTERGEVMTDGTPYVTYCDEAGLLFATTQTDQVYAIDPDTVAIQWEAKASVIGPTVDGTTYLAGGANLWAYRTGDGTLQWQTTLPDGLYPMAGFDSEIERRGQHLLVTIGEYGDAGVVALDPDTGDERWYYRPGTVEEGFAADEQLYVIFDEDDRENDLVRLNLTTGAEQWTYTADGSVSKFDIYPTTDAVYLRQYLTGDVVALNPVTGRERWRSEVYHNNEDTWVGDGAIYASMEEESGEYVFVAIDPETGRTRWETEVDEEVEIVSGLDREVGDIYIGTDGVRDDDDGTVYRLNRATGRIRWQFNVGERMRSLETESNPILIGPRYHETLYAVDRESGQPAWSFADESLSVRNVTEGFVVVSGTDRTHVLNRDDGTVALTPEQAITEGGTLFDLNETTISAHRLTDAPAAFRSLDESGSAQSPDEEADERCPNCETDVADLESSNFCPNCGQEL